MKLLVLCLLFGAVLALTIAAPSEGEPNDKDVAKPESVDETELTDDVPEPESVDEIEPTDAESDEDPDDPDVPAEETEDTELSEAENEDNADWGKKCVRTCRPGRWCKGGRRRYVYIPRRYHWSQAQRYCLRLRATLASVHNRRVDNFLKRLARGKPAWIGLFDAANERYWLWVNSGRLNYGGWCRKEPNNLRRSEHCAHINWTRKKCWNDARCTVRLPFICMK